ncbi:hypothetical protein [Nonomuraea sp. NPDC049695]|uniref:hypothetical protein n=1 Tax=Nonomuraea sp. NPDC049695 TaxID=3154734 RepID=UPI003419C576
MSSPECTGTRDFYLIEPGDTPSGRRPRLPRLRSIDPAKLDTRPGPPDQWVRLDTRDPSTPLAPPPAQRVTDRLRQLVTYLWGSVPDAAVPGEVLCERDLRPGHDGLTPYAAFTTGGRTHHVFVGGRPPQTDIRDLAGIVLLSGVCLFSANAAFLLRGKPATPWPIAHAREGRRISRITGLRVDDTLTIQEQEGTLRLPAVSSALAADISPQVPVRQIIDVPCAATMLTLLQHTYTGDLSARLLGRWCDRYVVPRHTRVAGLLQQRLEQARPPGSRPVEVEVRAPMPALADCLRRTLLAGRVPSLTSLIDLVAAEGPLWARLIDVVRPASPGELADLSYPAASLQAAHHEPGSPAPLVVIVDNPHEHKILRYARTYARALACGDDPVAIGPMIGVYPLPRLWTADRSGRLHHNLYAHDPGRRAVTADGRHIDLADLAANLYAPKGPQ